MKNYLLVLALMCLSISSHAQVIPQLLVIPPNNSTIALDPVPDQEHKKFFICSKEFSVNDAPVVVKNNFIVIFFKNGGYNIDIGDLQAPVWKLTSQEEWKETKAGGYSFYTLLGDIRTKDQSVHSAAILLTYGTDNVIQSVMLSFLDEKTNVLFKKVFNDDRFKVEYSGR